MIPWLIVLFTIVAVSFLEKWENKYLRAVFEWMPAILLAYLFPAAISGLIGRDYSVDPIHEYSKLYFIPLAIIAVMSSLSLKQLKSVGWKPIAIFLSGSFWIALFPVFMTFLFLDHQFSSEILIRQTYWKGIPPIVGSWIGGSTSQLVLKELVECPENIFLTILVMDNILVNIWTILMFQMIKRSSFLNKKLNISDLLMPEEIEQRAGKPMNPTVCFLILLASVLLTNFLVSAFVLKIVVLSIGGLLLSHLVERWNFKFALRLGGILILTVMAILGLKLKFSLIQFDMLFFGLLVIWLISHFIVMLITAKLLNANIAWVPIGSMANVGGIATAPAVTAAYEKKWMPHAIILAILSMATGTFWGMLTAFFLQQLLT